MNVWDLERLAEARLDAGPWGYYAGGAGDERTLADNCAAWGRRHLRPRVLVDVTEIDTRTTVLGMDLAMPLLVAPVALQKMAHPDGEAGMARATAAAGTAMCLSTIATSTPSQVRAGAPDAQLLFQIYVMRDRGITRHLVDEAVDSGFRALMLTVDAPRAGRRERDLRTGFGVPTGVSMPAVDAACGSTDGVTPAQFFSLVDTSVTWADVERMVSDSPVPFVIKGIHTAADAVLAVEHGAAAVVVSNHGGRQLDGVAATADVLPEVVEAVGGRCEVLVDGGIRRGTDVLTALALGADAVMIGRPALWGLAAGGQAGAEAVLRLFQDEIELGMLLLGTPAIADITRAHVS